MLNSRGKDRFVMDGAERFEASLHACINRNISISNAKANDCGIVVQTEWGLILC